MTLRLPDYHGGAVSAGEILRRSMPRDEIQTASGAAGVVLGLWLCGVFAASVFGRAESEGFEFTAILAGSILWPLLYFVISAQFVPRFPSAGARTAVLLFGVFAGASVYGSPILWTSFAYFILTLFSLYLVVQFNTVLSPAQYRTGMSLYAALTTLLLAYYALRYYQPGVRLGNEGGVLNPNSIGMVSLSVVAASFSCKGWARRLVVLAPAVAVLLLTDSRSAALGMVIAMTIILWGNRKQMGAAAMVILLSGLMLGVGVAAAYWSTVLAAIEGFFAVDNHYRGLGTGATGRLQAWRETWGLFTSHPFLGVGFRAHDVLIKSQTSAHNGYLALLAEIGIVGFSAVMYLLISGMWRLRSLIHNAETAPMASPMLGLCAGYCFIAIFERYLINIGNPTSLIFMLAILYKGGVSERASRHGTGE